ncbi:uncharacterized protein LOC123272195 [Cotesia glomerata]|uniref:Myb/SANT-like DNA-binding domain-containing protein n=1 Tax=Cotesia glomerata TaxID=32391 RepID=A0AAV7ISH5_COTGL|nr:uncharacterized protein LOC123272195 [Cotesia glomerata]KAH0567738.1 hypothetical protein KQX54_012943 [Cotesia glomerata]
MDECNYYSRHYEYNDLLYEISGTKEFHNKMITDWNYATSYLKEMVENQVLDEDVYVNDQVFDENVYANEEESSNLNQYEDFNNTEEIVEKDKNDKDDGSIWDNASIKLLLHEYLIQKNKFRSPKIKKITLWREISAEFEKQNLIFSADALSKKFGNMKTTYAKIKKNNSKKTTGAARKPWLWLNSMDEIFHNDLSINFRHDVVTSMPADVSDEVLNLSNSSSIRENGCGSSASSQASASSSNIVHSGDDSDKISQKCYKSARGKNIYQQRQKQLDLDSDKLEVMRGLKDTLEQCKNVQKENLLIWT